MQHKGFVHKAQRLKVPLKKSSEYKEKENQFCVIENSKKKVAREISKTRIVNLKNVINKVINMLREEYGEESLVSD